MLCRLGVLGLALALVAGIHGSASAPADAYTASGAGYTVTDSEEPGGPAYAWETPPAPTIIPWVNWDEETIAVPLGFTFSFFGVPQTTVNICTNGYLQFNGWDMVPANAAIPAAGAPNNIVAPFWDDLYVIGPSWADVRYQTLGLAGSLRFVVTWSLVTRTGFTTTGYVEDDSYTFQAVLYEGTNVIKFQYGTMSNGSAASPPFAGGESATIGIEDATGSSGLQYLSNGLPSANAVYSGLAIQFTPGGAAPPPPPPPPPPGGGTPGGSGSSNRKTTRTHEWCGGSAAVAGSPVWLLLALGALATRVGRRR